MPLIKIDIIKGVRTPEEIKKLADSIHKSLMETFATPPHDRFQVVTQHEPYELYMEDNGLNIPRSEKLVLVQIFQQGRNAEQKQALYKTLAKRLEAECGVPPTDLIISASANTTEDWSFGYGSAQFLTGEL